MRRDGLRRHHHPEFLRDGDVVEAPARRRRRPSCPTTGHVWPYESREPQARVLERARTARRRLPDTDPRRPGHALHPFLFPGHASFLYTEAHLTQPQVAASRQMVVASASASVTHTHRTRSSVRRTVMGRGFRVPTTCSGLSRCRRSNPVSQLNSMSGTDRPTEDVLASVRSSPASTS